MNETSSFLQKCKTIFTQYFSCTLLDGLIIGAANAVFLFAMRMPFVVLISVLAGLLNMVPTVGPVIGAVIGGLLLLFHRPSSALWFLLFTVLLQVLDSYLIRPKLFGRSLGIPSAAVLIVTIVGAHFFGILGLLFAVPAAAVLLMVIRERRRTVPPCTEITESENRP